MYLQTSAGFPINTKIKAVKILCQIFYCMAIDIPRATAAMVGLGTNFFYSKLLTRPTRLAH